MPVQRSAAGGRQGGPVQFLGFQANRWGRHAGPPECSGRSYLQGQLALVAWLGGGWRAGPPSWSSGGRREGAPGHSPLEPDLREVGSRKSSVTNSHTEY